MNTLAISPAAMPTSSGWRRFSLVRIVIGVLAVALPVVLTMFLVHQLVDKPLRGLWPQLVAAALCVGGYRLYVRVVERRVPAELATAGAWRELGSGVAIGAGLLAAVIGVLAVAGAYRVTGSNGWGVLAAPCTEAILVALFEELLFRGVLQRNLERALGSWPALMVSAILFGAAHIPNAGVTVTAVGVTIVAGLMFGAAYLATRRLWLAAGIHFGWNFASDAIFSVTTSGHPGKGILAGRLAGPDWLAGGAYGIEASLVTLAALALVTWGLLAVARRRGHLVGRGA